MKNRWLIAASAVGIHISIGSVYAYSAWKMPLENTFGWTSTNTSLAFSIAIFFLGLSAAFLGRYIERHGPSKGGLLSTAFFTVGLFGSALACYLESIWLFYLFFGVISGIGLGLGYISPVSTLVKWFPDRRGLATGLAIMGFGFGGLVCAHLIDVFNPAKAELVLPKDISGYEYVDMQASYPEKIDALLTGTPDLAKFKANEAELMELQREGVKEGAAFREVEEVVRPFHTVVLYDKSSIAWAFVALGVIYLMVMVPSALYIAPPPSDYEEKYFSEENSTSKQKVFNVPDVTAINALKTPGFYGLWFMLFINVSCGIAVIATAKKMGYEMVRLSVEMSSLLVMGISLFNGLGRIFWASLSDYIGRSNTYIAFFIIQIIAFPLLANLSTQPILFMIVTFVILTCYGGGFASIPAYISDLFGLKEMPTIHGFILTAWSLAGIVGPMLNSYVYEQTKSYQQSLYVFGGAFVVALIISLLMKFEIRRVNATVEVSK
ncbi:MAG: OFA family MFS transporter [Gracilimonas sp.]|jgi:OFA family oxalate/formate antiporter-like MFS transporter|nr:OFA family MFS transporter [Gracilimonas sp.]